MRRREREKEREGGGRWLTRTLLYPPGSREATVSLRLRKVGLFSGSLFQHFDIISYLQESGHTS